MTPLTLIVNLAIVAAVALGAIYLLWRTSTRRAPQSDLVLGYPPDQYPAHDVSSQAALRSLVSAQARLLAIYAGLPPASDSASYVHAFLLELRGIMDVAYQVAVITRASGPPPQLTRLAAEVEQLETQLTQELIHRLLSYEADAQEALLDSRFATLRALVREMTPGPETHLPLLDG